LHIVGGGCQNELLNQLCADACGIPVLAGPVEASTLGNIGCQLMALDEVRRCGRLPPRGGPESHTLIAVYPAT
jgi:sugar (pentulose or hexulose) kinase